VNIEIAFVISVWVVAFLICLASGIPLVVTIFVSSAMAYGLRKLWLRRLISFDEKVLSWLITILCFLFVITDRFGIPSFVFRFVFRSSDTKILILTFYSGVLVLGSILIIIWIIFGERLCLKLGYGAGVFAAVLVALLWPIGFLVLAATTVFFSTYAILGFSELQNDPASAILASILCLGGLFTCGVIGYYPYRGQHILIDRIRFVKALKLSARLSDEIARNERRGRFSESRQAIAQAMQPLHDVSGHFQLKSSLWETVGKIDLALTDFSSAKWYFDAALQAHDQIEEGDPVRRLALLENIGALSLRLGDWTVASDTLSEVATAKRAQLGSNHPDLAAALVKLGMVHQMLGRYSDAKRDLDAALTIQRRVLPNDSVTRTVGDVLRSDASFG
jgi:hypothetical protein